jgi:hypothetical protein|tara:strand:+ start:1080 stop:1451 length:372 start_codon:yes stop_codon:yes gene_type:complete
MSSQILLSGGDKYYSYSGVLFGDVSVPATIQMINIDNTGLKDSYIKISPFFGKEVSSSSDHQLGVSVKLDDVEIINRQNFYYSSDDGHLELFMPRNSKLEILSLNTTNNNTQTRGVTLIGYYL